MIYLALANGIEIVGLADSKEPTEKDGTIVLTDVYELVYVPIDDTRLGVGFKKFPSCRENNSPTTIMTASIIARSSVSSEVSEKYTDIIKQEGTMN